MKKRIGSILYDTEKSFLVLEPDLYRKKNSFLFFRFDGESIIPISINKAESIIKESGNTEAIRYLEYSDKDSRNIGSVSIGIDRLRRLSAYCRRHKTSQKKVIESLIDTLPDD